MKVKDKLNEQLILERKNGQNLDWSFQSLDNDVAGEVKAHKSIVFQHSHFLRDLHKSYVDRNGKKSGGYPIMQLIQFTKWIFINFFIFCYSFILFSISIPLSIENTWITCDFIVWTFGHYQQIWLRFINEGIEST